jgi:hypothetical protein
MDEDLEKLTKALLQDRLRSLGCASSGNKSELIQRLREKYLVMDAEQGAESDSDDDVDQYADQVEQMMEQAAEHREEGMQDEDAEFDYKDVKFFGTLYRDEALAPTHLYHCPLFKRMMAHIQLTYNVRFIRLDTSALIGIPIDSQDVLNNSRSPKTQQAYMTIGCLFLIYTCFCTREPVAVSSALFTWKNCAQFLQKYVTMPKPVTMRGTSGLTVPSMGMVNKCAMVLNGMFRRERECFKSYLQHCTFPGKEEFFKDPIQDARPAVAHNQDWREIYKRHSFQIRKGQLGNSLPNSEVVKAGVRLTEEECYAIAHLLMGNGGFNNTRNATVIATNLVAISRTGDVTHSLFKDISHKIFQCGTTTADLYTPAPASEHKREPRYILPP